MTIASSEGRLRGEHHWALTLAGKLVLKIARPIRVTPPPLIRQRICSFITNYTDKTVYMLP